MTSGDLSATTTGPLPSSTIESDERNKVPSWFLFFLSNFYSFFSFASVLLLWLHGVASFSLLVWWMLNQSIRRAGYAKFVRFSLSSNRIESRGNGKFYYWETEVELVCLLFQGNSILFYILFFSDLIGFKTMVRMDGKIISRGFLWTIKSITNRENVALIELMRNLYLSISFRPFGLITMTVPPILLLLAGLGPGGGG